jgi:hypothetical protein
VPLVPVPVEPAELPPLVPVLEPLVLLPDVPVPLDPLVPVEVPLEPAEFPLVDEPALLPPLVDEPALLAPLRSLVLVRLRLVSLEELEPLGRVVGSLLVVLLEPLVSRVRVPLVPLSVLSQPMKAMPPKANAAATKML